MKTRFVGVRAGPREVDEATSAAKLMSEKAQDVAKQAREMEAQTNKVVEQTQAMHK